MNTCLFVAIVLAEVQSGSCSTESKDVVPVHLDPEVSGIDGHGENCLIGETCQQRSASLIQRNTFKAHVEPSMDANSAVPVNFLNFSGGDDNIAPAVAAPATDPQHLPVVEAPVKDPQHLTVVEALATDPQHLLADVVKQGPPLPLGAAVGPVVVEPAVVLPADVGLDLNAVSRVPLAPNAVIAAPLAPNASDALAVGIAAVLPAGDEASMAPVADPVADIMASGRQMTSVAVDAQPGTDLASGRQMTSVSVDQNMAGESSPTVDQAMKGESSPTVDQIMKGESAPNQETLPTRTQTKGESDSDHSYISDLSNGLKDVDEFLRGKPQVLSIFVMMLLPLGICAVMCCVFNIIRVMEDSATGEETPPSGGVVETRPTLGEVRRNAVVYEPLCAELLAPGCDNECLIAIPSVNEGQHINSTFERVIVSKTGQPIVTVRVAVSRVTDAPDAAGGGTCGVPGQTQERISLVAFKKQNALGFCEFRVPNRAITTPQPLKCSIYRPTGDLFATVEEESTGVVSSLLAASSTNVPRATARAPKCYMLTTVATGTRFWIQGDIETRHLVVVSESDDKKPIITVDPGDDLQFKQDDANYYRLRVQPRGDAGVIIMALLAMDRLQGTSS